MLKSSSIFTSLVTSGLMTLPLQAFSDEAQQSNLKATDHAPIGVMGDHLHKKGEFMFSYRFMQMSMSGNLQGSDSISDDDIVTSVTAPNSSMNYVRVVPQTMTQNMHMLGFMYAPTDHVTLMAMVNYIDNDMTLTTYSGASGTTVLDNFNTASSGLGDTKLTMLYSLIDTPEHKFHVNLGWVLPTGSIEETDQVLTPMNMLTNLRLPYSMQLGGGSHRAEFGLTYNGNNDNLSWGAQGLYNLALSENDEDYETGKTLKLSTWANYGFSDAVSATARLTYNKTQEIVGEDENLTAPVTTANPANYGGTLLMAAIGINTVIANKHRVAFEYEIPVIQDVNGVQMEMDNMFTIGYQLAF
ncbi:transporter [Paraglaciecola marina]|uniref:transporter n=1 Tax=Paraglaciecola marina TaxID=2500157 RepID=UPI00105F72AD|nr:transporter [Paraglaciecola marina]